MANDLDRIAFGDRNHQGSEYTEDECEFMLAIDRYKRVNQRPYPMWSEVLHIALSLGYRKVAKPTPLPKFRSKEHWNSRRGQKFAQRSAT